LQRKLGWTGWIVCAFLLPAWTGATGQASDNLDARIYAEASAKVIAWANANLASYKQAIDYAKHAPPPQVPVPPLVDPPCRSCDAADTPTPGEAQVTAWIKQSEAPEAGYLKTLASIGKQVSNFSGVGKTGLSPAADKALAQFSEADIQAAIWKLSDRLLIGKAIPMAQKYDSEPKRAYAGISFLLKEARDAAQVHGSDYSGSQQAGDLAIAWQQSIAKTIDNDVVAGHKYNLCPVYGTVYRELELLGGSPRQDRPESRLAAPAGAAAESDSPRLEPECPALCSHSVQELLSSFTFLNAVNCGGSLSQQGFKVVRRSARFIPPSGDLPTYSQQSS